MHRDLIELAPVIFLIFINVSHAWAFFLLECVGIPERFFDAILASYKLSRTYMNIQSGPNFKFMVLSGVLQGCPLSGTLFVISVDPSLHLFDIHFVN